MFDGNFVSGALNGEGHERQVDGTLYDGEFRGGKRHGEISYRSLCSQC